MKRNQKLLSKNILAVLNRASASTVRDGTDWYHNVHGMARRIGRAHSRPIEDVATVIAILSPACTWDQNIKDAETMVRAHANGSPLDSFNVSTYGPNKRKAWRYLGGTLDPIFGKRAIKTSRFASLIERPFGLDVVLDGHAVNIATDTRQPIRNAPRLLTRSYGVLEASYQAVALAK